MQLKTITIDSADYTFAATTELNIKFKNNCPPENRIQILSSKQMAGLFRSVWCEDNIEYQESFKVAYFNNAKHLLGYFNLSIGADVGCIADAKIIFAVCLNIGANSIAVAHNHPSGILLPSRQDEKLTKKLVTIAGLFSIEFLDHIILTSSGYYSFADSGILPIIEPG